jgi:hypothetical protein
MEFLGLVLCWIAGLIGLVFIAGVIGIAMFAGYLERIDAREFNGERTDAPATE